MSRAKQYDRTELLDKSIELFRRNGFNGTSTAELVDTLGVNRKSMYSEFGSKQGLFEAALERYDAMHLSRVIAPFEKEGAGLQGILKAFYHYAKASEGNFKGLGCLMCNTAVERGALDPGTGRFVTAYLERITTAFHRALNHAQQTGELSISSDIDDLAQFLTTLLVGMAAGVRAEAPPQQLWSSYQVVLNMLRLS